MGIGVEDIRRFEKRGQVISSKITSLLPDIKFDLVEMDIVSIDQGKDIAKKNWKEALKVFGAIYSDNSRTNEERVEGAIQASQMLVNLGRLKQADGILDGSLRLLSKISDEKAVLLLSAGILEKRAWVADYKGKSKNAITFLNKSKEIYDSFGLDLPLENEDSKSTVEHFLGRSNFSLGHIDQAILHFESDLARYVSLSEKGEPRPGGEAFNNAWLARCYIHKNESEKAHEYLDKTFNLFMEEGKLNNDEAAMAHYYLVNSEIALIEGNPTEAVVSAKKALEISATKEPIYIKGGIDAILVLSIAYWQIGKSYIYSGSSNTSS